MKIVHAKVKDTEVVVPIHGGIRVQFADHHAVVKDDVAETLVNLGGGFYRIVAEDLTQVERGAKVLLVRDTGMGDVLMLTPLIRRLHEDRGLLVDVLTEEKNRSLFDGNPHVNATFALEKDTTVRAEYAYVLDLRLVVENAERFGINEHRADAFASYADVRLHGPEDRVLDYFVSDDERRAFQDRFSCIEKQSMPDGTLPKTIAYVWRASTGTGGNRTWSDETQERVLFYLLAAGYVVILLDVDPIPPQIVRIKPGVFPWALGGHPNLIDWSGKLSIRETGAVIDAADVVIAPDTGLFHMAGALGKPTITYFGAFPVEERHAHRRLNVVNDAAGQCARASCRSYGCLNRDEYGQPVCLTVDPLRVVDTVAGFIADAHIAKSERTSDHVDAIVAGYETPPDSQALPGDDESGGGEAAGQGRGTRADDSGLAPTEARESRE